MALPNQGESMGVPMERAPLDLDLSLDLTDDSSGIDAQGGFAINLDETAGSSSRGVDLTLSLEDTAPVGSAGKATRKSQGVGELSINLDATDDFQNGGMELSLDLESDLDSLNLGAQESVQRPNLSQTGSDQSQNDDFSLDLGNPD
ncbi:MAG: hypothetical protein CO187_07190, partial [Zetaproteobacteria bacterium CG_4_9_14_3_um_filter_53_7]